jgi:hypothetical protein
MVLLTQGKPGMLVQGHSLPCTRKDAVYMRCCAVKRLRPPLASWQSGAIHLSDCVHWLLSLGHQVGQPCFAAMIQATAVVRAEAREVGPTQS